MSKLKFRTPEGIQAETKSWTKGQKLQHVLSKFKEAGRKVQGLNNGGCAIIAYGILKYSKILGIDAKVIYMFNEYSKHDFHKIKNNRNASCSHAVIGIDNKVYDSNGEFSPTDYFGEDEIVTALEVNEDVLKRSIAYRKHWNPRFNRRKGKKQIQEILGIPLKIKIKEA